MNTLIRKLAVLTSLIAVSVSIPMTLLQAAAVDFSCMTYHVKGKTQVSANHREYDIAVENHCPGAVYWTMCIERMQPWTNEIQEALTPSGLLQKDKKSKVNLQMKKYPDESKSREAYQSFYLGVGYALRPPAQARCSATSCESKVHGLRKQIGSNDTAWHKAVKAMATRISTECPQSGWENTPQTDCEAKIRSSNEVSMSQFSQKSQQLKNKMSELTPEQCQIYGSS